MGELEGDFWKRLDQECVEAEAELEREQKWLETDVQGARDEFAEYLATLSIDEMQTAIQGLIEYEQAVQAERDIRAGHLRYED